MFAGEMDGSWTGGLGIHIHEPEAPQCGTEPGIGREKEGGGKSFSPHPTNGTDF